MDLWKNPVFRLFELLVFIDHTGLFFFFLEYRETHFPGLFFLKYKNGKIANFYQNHGLTTLEKSQFFDFLNFLFLPI